MSQMCHYPVKKNTRKRRAIDVAPLDRAARSMRYIIMNRVYIHMINYIKKVVIVTT